MGSIGYNGREHTQIAGFLSIPGEGSGQPLSTFCEGKMALLAMMSMMAIPHQPTEHVRLMACAVQTEASLLGEWRVPAGMWVAHTAMNRAEAGWFGPLSETLREDFHGVRHCSQPEPWAISVAIQALMRTEDKAKGSLFVLSYDDLKRMGPGGHPVRCFEDGQSGLCFFGTWE